VLVGFKFFLNNNNNTPIDCVDTEIQHVSLVLTIEMTGNVLLHSLFLPFPAMHSHSFPFPFSSLSLIFNPMIFPFGYSHSRPIPKTRTEQESVNASSRRSSNRKTVRQKTGHQSSKNNIHNTLKIRQNISTDILQNVVYIMVERQNGKQILGNFFPHWIRGHSHSHLP